MIFKQSTKLIGEIAQFRVVMISEKSTSRELDGVEDHEDENYRVFLRFSDKIAEEITIIARKELGKEFLCHNIQIIRGSIEINYIISAAYEFYLGVSKYKNFIESLNIFKDQVNRMLAKFTIKPMIISGSTVMQSQALLNVNRTQNNRNYSNDCDMCALFWFGFSYVILTHAIFLIVMIYLLVK